LIGLRVAPDKLPFEFEPGQYVVLGLEGPLSRGVAEADADAPTVTDGEAPAGTRRVSRPLRTGLPPRPGPPTTPTG